MGGCPADDPGVSVAELDGEGGLGDQHGKVWCFVYAAEGDLLPTVMIIPVLLAPRAMCSSSRRL